MKVTIADGLLADTADLIFSLPFPVQMLDAWTGVLAFSAQIFCDFAGYSTCAIGVSLCLGFVLPDNFHIRVYWFLRFLASLAHYALDLAP